MKTIVILALSSLVLAGTAGVHAAEPPEQKGQAPKSAGPSATRTDALSADMEATLRKTGQAVAMVLNPGTMTEMVTLDPHSGSSAGGDGAHRPLTGSGTFTTVLATERLASTLIGLVVHDASGAELATVKDIAIDHDGLQSYILALGGMLGIGDRYVAVTPSAITIAYDQVANRYAATMAATTDQLKAAPAFTYDGAFKAGRN
jgi:sporulation protein YlmC with PRC-barrel domain